MEILPIRVTSTNDFVHNPLIGSILIKKSSVNKALTICIHQDNINPLQKSTDSLYYQAVLLENIGDYKSAIVRLKKALKENVDDRQAILNLLVTIYRKLEVAANDNSDS